MKRIGLTQRVRLVTDLSEQQDCLDQRWAHIIERFDSVPVPLPNTVSNIVNYCRSLYIDAVVLTGGNDLCDAPGARTCAQERDRTEIALLQYACEQRLPVLGVCRGMQMLAAWFGGRLERAGGHAGTRHRLTWVDNEAALSPLQVNSYHDFVVRDIADCFVVEAVADDGTIEAVSHRNLPLKGMMWHPEREEVLTAYDIKVFNELASRRT